MVSDFHQQHHRRHKCVTCRREWEGRRGWSIGIRYPRSLGFTRFLWGRVIIPLRPIRAEAKTTKTTSFQYDIHILRQWLIVYIMKQIYKLKHHVDRTCMTNNSHIILSTLFRTKTWVNKIIYNCYDANLRQQKIQ